MFTLGAISSQVSTISAAENGKPIMDKTICSDLSRLVQDDILMGIDKFVEINGTLFDSGLIAHEVTALEATSSPSIASHLDERRKYKTFIQLVKQCF